MLPQTPRAAAVDRQPAPADRVDSRRDLQAADAVAARAGGAASEPADGARLRQPAVHRVHRDQRRPPLCRRPRDRRRLRALQGRARADRRPPQGGGGDTKQKIFRNFGYARPEGYRKALRAMKLAEKFSRAGHRVHRHAGRVSGHRIGGARHLRGDRASTCARWPRSTRRSSSSCTAKAAAAARSASRSAIAS